MWEAAGEGFEPSLPDPESGVVRTTCQNHSTNTYSTTYERGSKGIHKDLTTSPQYKKPADKGQMGSNGGPRTDRTYRYESEGRGFESCRARPSSGARPSPTSLHSPFSYTVYLLVLVTQGSRYLTASGRRLFRPLEADYPCSGGGVFHKEAFGLDGKGHQNVALWTSPPHEAQRPLDVLGPYRHVTAVSIKFDPCAIMGG